MIILDKPYVSPELKTYLTQSQTPVLKNSCALAAAHAYKLNLLENKEFIQAQQEGGRLLCISENSLAWVKANLQDTSLIRCLDLMKNKISLRQIIQKIYPNFFFQEISLGQLSTTNYADLPKIPLVLKPAIGFLSAGIYPIRSAQDWVDAQQDILGKQGQWAEEYPEYVLNHNTFILEQYISGPEYALDAYYDDQGQAVIVNLMQHRFLSPQDVRDRLYLTSEEIIRKYLNPFTDFLNQVNTFIQARNFPVHVELRVKENGEIIPIEFNPLRFAGWCGTEIAYFAFGLRTYAAYFNQQKPDWDALLTQKAGKLYTMILLDKPPGYQEPAEFNYAKLLNCFQRALALRKFDYRIYPIFGFLFTETNLDNQAELDFILSTDLREFLTASG